MPRLPGLRSLRRSLLVVLPVALLPMVVVGQSTADPVRPAPAGSLFTAISGLDLAARDAAGHPAVVRPSSYAAFALDPDRARTVLAAAPTASAGRPLELSVPDPSGSMVPFALVEDSVLEPGLAAAHPEIATYAGRALDGSARSIRLDVGTLGLHASVRSPGGGASWYVDPAYARTGATQYLSYYGAAVPASSAGFVERDLADTQQILAQAPTAAAARPAAGALVTRRTYRMAFVTDPTYAAYFGMGNVMSAKVALVNRADQVYNDDLAIEFVLIDGTDKLNLDTDAKASMPNGPCGASACYDVATYKADGTAGDTPDGCTSDLLTRNQFALGQLVGADTFDIGHIGLGVNGGGIAGLGVVGGASKASGCTGLPAPTGDFYAVDYFSHEVGHQMGGNHTFNGNQVNCSTTNRNGGTSVEPGSGTSVMAYAGICGQDNLQPHSDPYFSQRSIDEIDTVATSAPSTVDEVQTISLAGFDATGDSFQLTYPGATPVTLTYGTLGYNQLTVTQAVQQLTGCLPQVTDYDDATTPSVGNDGFTVTFGLPACSGTDMARLGVTGGTGGVTGFVGVQANGGPSTNAGSTLTPTTNHAPTVVAPADKTIPIRTPFTLSGTATDVDPGDDGRLVYLWEQNDTGSVSPTGGTALVSGAKIDGPLFRVFGKYADVSTSSALQTPSPGQNVATVGTATRTFPDIDQVLSDNTNAETGGCPTAPAIPTPATGRSNVPVDTVECYAEFLPTAAYGAPAAGLPSLGGTLDFRLTARDLYPTGGGTQYDDVALTVDNTTGPFQVTSRAVPGSPATGGGQETVTWDVNGTDAPALAPTVRISLSTDGGQSFTPVLASTPNDGSQAITLPNVSTTRARIKVEAVGNYFFDVNDADFTIAATPVTPAGPGASGAGAVTGAAAALRTKTRIRLPRPVQVLGRKSVRLLFQVTGAVASTGPVGTVVVRIDGRKVRTLRAPVTLKQGKRVVGFSMPAPRALSPGSHRVLVTFKPTDAAAYTPSRSRAIVLTVVRAR